MRDAAINLRALPEQKSLIAQAAALTHKSISDFMLDVACEKARTVMLDQTVFYLTGEQMQDLNALLDAPPQPNAGLQRLMAVEAPWKAR